MAEYQIGEFPPEKIPKCVESTGELQNFSVFGGKGRYDWSAEELGVDCLCGQVIELPDDDELAIAVADSDPQLTRV